MSKDGRVTVIFCAEVAQFKNGGVFSNVKDISDVVCDCINACLVENSISLFDILNLSIPLVDIASSSEDGLYIPVFVSDENEYDGIAAVPFAFRIVVDVKLDMLALDMLALDMFTLTYVNVVPDIFG